MPTPEIHIQLVDNAEPLLAYARVPLTLFNRNHIIVELKVLSGKNGPWVALPQRKEGDEWTPIVQIPEDVFQRVKHAVLLAYNAAKHEQPSSEQTTKRSESVKPKKASHSVVSEVSDDNSSRNAPKKESVPLEQLSVAELIKLQPPRRIHLHDRQKRIAFLESKYGDTFKGKPIKFMTNRQLYAISKVCGYR